MIEPLPSFAMLVCRMTVSLAALIASGGTLVLNETTPITLGIFVGGVILSCTVTWKAASKITKLLDQISDLASRVVSLEQKMEELREIVNTKKE